MKMGITLIISILVLTVLLGLSGFFSGSETAITSLDEFEVEKMKKNGWKNAKEIEKLKRNPRDTLTTILIGNNLVNVAASALATFISINVFGSAGVGIATGIMTFLILIFGEITPKTFCVSHSKEISSKVARPLLFLTWALRPISRFLQGITNVIISRMGGREEGKELSEEDLKLMVAMGGKQGSIKEKEKEMVHNVFELDDVSVENIMIPREGMVCIEDDKTIKEAEELLKETIYSRIPTYGEGKNDITGILLSREALARENKDVEVKEITEKPLFFDPQTKIDEALRDFRSNKIHLGIVKREDDVIGLVTLEDVLEEIVGEIEDETDRISYKRWRRVE